MNGKENQLNSEPTFANLPEDVLAGRAISPAILQDLYRISSLTPLQCADVSDALAGMEVTGDASDVPNVVQRALGVTDDDMLTSVLRLVVNVPSDDVVSIIAKLKAWVDGHPSRAEVFPEERMLSAAASLCLLIADYPIIELNRKAQAIVQGVGNKFRDIKFLCDLRPVFDNERENVEAFILLANLRLGYESQDGRERVCEMSLTEEQLLEIRKEIDRALSKLEKLKPLGAGMISSRSIHDKEDS